MKKKFSGVIVVIFIVAIMLYITVSAANEEEVYLHNLKIYESQPTDPAALEFYKLPSRNDDIKSDAGEIADLAKLITANIPDDYEKIKAIHDWVANNIYFDYDASVSKDYEDTSALSVLELKRNVCEGYAKLTVALLRSAGIPAKYIDGFALGVHGIEQTDVFYDLNNDEINHAWCEAFADNRWIIMDPTWDSLNKYINGEFKKSPCADKYFDISLKDISGNHKYKDYLFDFRLFDLSGYTSITVPESITVIGDLAFNNCVDLENIIMHNGITRIGVLAFQNCINLTDITIPGSVETIESRTFKNCTGLTNIIIPDSVTNIGKQAFESCVSLTSVKIPDGVTVIESGLFSNCANLKYAPIHGGITNIESSAFQDCVSLTSVKIPESVTSIENNVFNNCTNLKNIILHNGITRIGNRAFNNCISLTEMIIPDNVQSIGPRAFQNCINLISVTMPDGIIMIREGTFQNCANLTNITIPQNVRTIADYAFQDCASLTSIIIPDCASYIGRWAFSNCINLTNIEIPECVTSLGYSFVNYYYLMLDIDVEVSQMRFYDYTIFEGCDNDKLTIYGEAGSIAEEYAEQNGIKFIAGKVPVSEPIIISETPAFAKISVPVTGDAEKASPGIIAFIIVSILLLLTIGAATVFIMLKLIRKYNFTKN
ncbi:MAG: leucine-rich repeat protein [Oscillospiraceae bacterium]|nr:leucine-rich repeat protein [Oscillospiraceae bacterium]